MADITRVPVSSALIDGYSPNTQGQPKQSKISLNDYYVWLRKMPEVAGVMSALCNDIMGEGFEFRGTKAGVKSAEEFCKRNHFAKKFFSTIQDLFLIGDAYLGKRIINSYYVNKKIDKFISNDNILKSAGLEKESLLEKLKVRNPDMFYPREIFPLKASTITIDYDVHGRIQQYIQKVDGNATEVSFDPSEVVHFSLNNLGNDVYGNTPFVSSLHAVATLWYAQDYAGMFFQNDGTPDKMYVLEDTAPGSPEYESFRKQIEQFKKSKNKHKSMVMTGKVDVTDLNKFDKDLEFSKLIDKFTQRLMMAWNMPPSRLSEISSSNSTSKEALAGYYKNVNRMQKEIEETLNSELWAHFGEVEMVFNKVYKRDESVEADIVVKAVGKPIWTQNEGRIYMGLKPLPDPKYDEINDNFEENPGGQMPDTKEGDEVGNQYRPAEKVFMDGSSVVVDSFSKFLGVVESDGRVFEKCNVLVDESDSGYSFLYKNGDKLIECNVPLVDAKNIPDFETRFLKSSIKSKIMPSESKIVAKNMDLMLDNLAKSNKNIDKLAEKMNSALLKKNDMDSEKFNNFLKAFKKSNDKVELLANKFSKAIEDKNSFDSEKMDSFMSAIDKTKEDVKSISEQVSKASVKKNSINSKRVETFLKELNKTNMNLESMVNKVSTKAKVSKIVGPKEVEKKSGMNGAVVKMSSFSQFKRIVEAGDRTFMTAKVFVDETPTGFDFCFSDSVATYECFVSKDLIKDEKNFRFSYVEHSFKGKLI